MPDPLLGSGKPSRPQTWNRYAFVVNNPLRMIDPDGLDGEDSEEQRRKATTRRTIYVFVGGKDRSTPFTPSPASARQGYKSTTVPGDNFADLAKNAPKGLRSRSLTKETPSFHPKDLPMHFRIRMLQEWSLSVTLPVGKILTGSITPLA
jgi:hypothetical protein